MPARPRVALPLPRPLDTCGLCSSGCTNPPFFPPRPKRIAGGTSDSDVIDCASLSTSDVCGDGIDGILGVVAGDPASKSWIWLTRGVASPSQSLASSSSLLESESESESSSSISSSSTLVLFSLGFHFPRIILAPSPHRFSSPPTPLLVTAKKYSFGYECACMRCSRRAFGVKNLRGHDARWHANYVRPAISRDGACTSRHPRSSRPVLFAAPQADRGTPFGAELAPKSAISIHDDGAKRPLTSSSRRASGNTSPHLGCSHTCAWYLP